MRALPAFFRTAFKASLIVFLSWAVSGCSAPPKHPSVETAGRARPSRPHYTADIVVAHAAFAQLAATDGMAAARPHLACIEAYTHEKQTRSAPVPVAIFSYTVAGTRAVQRVAVPAVLPPEEGDPGALLNVAATLSGPRYRLQDVHVALVRVPMLKPVTFPQDDAGSRLILDREEQLLLRKAVTPLPLREAQMQVQLAGFFILHHMRDAAYLSVENAQQALAQVPERSPDDRRNVQALSAELESMESHLHTALPFTLRSF